MDYLWIILCQGPASQKNGILKFSGPARVCESHDAAAQPILTNEIKPGDVVVVRYEGPRGGPGNTGDAVSHQLFEI
jgi:dihydroxyacid dehydratase/phosphogluconate dehydratase